MTSNISRSQKYSETNKNLNRKDSSQASILNSKNISVGLGIARTLNSKGICSKFPLSKIIKTRTVFLLRRIFQMVPIRPPYFSANFSGVRQVIRRTLCRRDRRKNVTARTSNFIVRIYEDRIAWYLLNKIWNQWNLRSLFQ